MASWIRFDKSPFGMYGAIIFFNKVELYAGKTDHWGISFDVNFYDRSITFEILNLYAGMAVYHKDIDNKDEN